jgi:hypothetical protein
MLYLYELGNLQIGNNLFLWNSISPVVVPMSSLVRRGNSKKEITPYLDGKTQHT